VLDEVFTGTRHQRCWVQEVSNVLGKFPKFIAPTVKSDLRDIWQAEASSASDTAIDTFAEKYGDAATVPPDQAASPISATARRLP
jgi:transposase-like protein